MQEIEPPPPNSPTLVRLCAALCLTYHPSLPTHPSLSLRPPSLLLRDIPRTPRLLSRARAHATTSKPRFGVIYVRIYDEDELTTYVYARVCALALCKSVRYLDTCKGKCVRAYAHPPLPFRPSPRLRFVFSPLHPKPSLTKGWTRHWRSSTRTPLFPFSLFSLFLFFPFFLRSRISIRSLFQGTTSFEQGTSYFKVNSSHGLNWKSGRGGYRRCRLFDAFTSCKESRNYWNEVEFFGNEVLRQCARRTSPRVSTGRRSQRGGPVLGSRGPWRTRELHGGCRKKRTRTLSELRK